MQTVRPWMTVSLAVVLAYTCLSAQTPSLSAAGKEALSRFVTSAVARGAAPGLVALVVNRDEVMYEAAFGKLDVARNIDMPADAIFRIASMTKPITSVAVMMLVEEGKVRLDDPVSAYLSGYSNPQVVATFNPADSTYQGRPAARPITIRHLLAHTSGIGYTFSNAIVARLQQASQKSEVELPLVHDPGDKWTYGASTRVLGDLVATISGRPLDVFFQDRIFAPLRMVDTSFSVPAHTVSRVATAHRRTDGTLAEQPNPRTLQSPVRGDGGLYSTARDYGQFVQMLLNGGTLRGAKVLDAASVQMMGQNQTGAVVVEEQPAVNPAVTRPFPIGAGKDTFGLGFQIAAFDQRYAKLRSPGSLSWAGINNTHFWIDPTKQIGVVLLMQVLPFYDARVLELLRGFEELLYAHLR